jgi:hypothetical protein
VLLSIHCVSCEEVSNARAILVDVGAVDIASFGEESIAGYDVPEHGTEFVTNTSAHAGITAKVEAIQ